MKTITFPAFPSIEGVQQPDEDTDTQYIGPIAQEYLRKFATKAESDKTYGLYDKSGNFYIGNKPVIIVHDNVVVDGEEYQGTAGLWELIVTKTPDPAIYTHEDYDNYAKLMVQSNALKMGNDPESNRPKSSKAKKWRNVLKPIWEKRRYFEGSGTGTTTTTTTVIIPCDPNALLERLDLLMASKAAGNTGVRNELVSICDELKRQNIIDTNMYKKNYVFYLKMLLLKNRGFKRQYVYGGSGLFDSIASFIARLFTSSAAKQIASTEVDVGKMQQRRLAKRHSMLERMLR